MKTMLIWGGLDADATVQDSPPQIEGGAVKPVAMPIDSGAALNARICPVH